MPSQRTRAPDDKRDVRQHVPFVTARETSFASAASKPATHRGQDDQFNYLAILATFVKQRTYLATLLSFGHLALIIWPPCPIAPYTREMRKRRNLTSSVRRRFAQGDLSSLTSLSSHIFYRHTVPLSSVQTGRSPTIAQARITSNPSPVESCLSKVPVSYAE